MMTYFTQRCCERTLTSVTDIFYFNGIPQSFHSQIGSNLKGVFHLDNLNHPCYKYRSILIDPIFPGRSLAAKRSELYSLEFSDPQSIGQIIIYVISSVFI